MSTPPFYDELTWYNAADFTIRGQAWCDDERAFPFDRLPRRHLVPELSERLRADALKPRGISVSFKGAPKNLYARFNLEGPQPETDFMSQLGTAGLDLYCRGTGEAWTFAGSRWPYNWPNCDGQLNNGKDGMDGVEREWRVYLPLGCQVSKLEIGAREALTASTAPSEKPIVYYGTSIVAGACVSRPGMPHAAQLDRMLDREIINLGFPGMAYCEPAMASAIAELDPVLFIVDCIPNNSPAEIHERVPGFIRTLRQARPATPILLVQDRNFDNGICTPRYRDERLLKNKALDEVIAGCQRDGLSNLHLARHPNWYGNDGSVDGSHPNDLGAYRLATRLLPTIQSLLE